MAWRWLEWVLTAWSAFKEAVDAFLDGKQESLSMIERDNYQKWYFRKEQDPPSPDRA